MKRRFHAVAKGNSNLRKEANKMLKMSSRIKKHCVDE